ncbi:MAG: hypothetical protein QXJ18_04515 [Desulfurococcaceae archaeon]
MYVALLLLATALALLSALDILTDITAITLAGVGAIELGLLNSLSYVAYILSLLLGGKRSEKGFNRAHVVYAFLSFLAYALSMYSYIVTRKFAFLMLSYLLHPISTAYTRILTLTYIQDVFESRLWRKALLVRFTATSTVEAFILTFIPRVSAIGVEKMTFFAVLVSVLIYVLSLVIIKEPVFRIERILYRLESALEYLEANIEQLLTYTFLSQNLTHGYRLAKYYKPRTKPQGLVMLSLIAFKLGSTIMLVPIPIILMSKLNASLYTVLWIYGVSRLVILTSLLYEGSDRVKALLYLLEPVLWGLIINSSNPLHAGFLLGLILYINGGVDVSLYSLYLKTTRGRNAFLYLLVGELAAAVGATASGYLYSMLGHWTIILVLTCALLGSLAILT